MSRRVAHPPGGRGLRVRVEPGSAVIVVTRDIDARMVERLADAMALLVGGGARRVVVELRGVRTVDAVGLAFLRRARRRLEARRGELEVRGASADVHRLLELCGLAPGRAGAPAA